MPTELRERFTRKQWKDCCGKGCKKCEIAQAYVGEHGKKKGLALLNEDRAAASKAKKAKKAAAKKDKSGGTGADKKAKAGGKKGKKG